MGLKFERTFSMCSYSALKRSSLLCKTSFQLRMNLIKYRNKAEMKECYKSTLHGNLLCIFADVRYSSCIVLSIPCLCPFSGPSVTEMKFY